MGPISRGSLMVGFSLPLPGLVPGIHVFS